MLKPALTCLLVLLSTLASAADKSLVLDLALGRAKATRARDLSGKGNHGRIHGGARTTRAGKISALRFDGKDDYVECPRSRALDVERAATLEVWCRPAPAQGGLVCRVTGGGWKDQRMVLAVNTHRDARELMWVLADDHVFQKGALDAPPDNQWQHIALTYDGALVKIFVDGLLVDTGGGIRQELSMQIITPEFTDIPLWIGRSSGLGKPYFKGLISRVRIYNRALSEQEIFSRFVSRAKAYGKDSVHPGKVTLDVHQYPNYGLLSARLDVRCLWPLPQDARLETTLHKPEQGEPLRQFSVAQIPDYGKTRAVFNIPDLPPGDYEIRTKIVPATGTARGNFSTKKVTWPGSPEYFRDGRVKRLNNMVFELLNTQQPAKESRFYNFREGWVFVASTSKGSAKLSIGSDPEPAIVHAPDRPPVQEAMRYLPEGEHRIKVTGPSPTRLIVRAIPEIIIHHPSAPHVREFGKYDKEFARKHLLDSINANIHGHDYGPNHSFPAEQLVPDWLKLHRRWYIHTRMPGYRELRSENRAISGDEAYNYWANYRTYADPRFAGFFADEIGSDNHPMNDSWREAALKMKADPRFKDKRLYVYTTSMYPFPKAVAYAETLIECGYGVAWKRYLAEAPYRQAAERHIYARLDQEMQQWRAAQPGVEKGMCVVPAYFSAPPESCDIRAGANFKVFMDMECHTLANAPAFSGTAAVLYYLASYADDETVRWSGKLFRHYFIEGNRDMLSTDPYDLTHLRNGDFTDAGEGWGLSPAQPGAITFRKIPKYGYFQARYPGRFNVGDWVLATRRNAKAPNTFSQEIRDLVPGKLYSFRMYTGDYGELTAGKSTKQTYAMSIKLEDAEELKDRGFQHIFGNCHGWGAFKKRNACWMNFHWRIFRATAPTARLTVSDWASADKPGGPIDQQLIHNFVQIQPYMDR